MTNVILLRSFSVMQPNFLVVRKVINWFAKDSKHDKVLKSIKKIIKIYSSNKFGKPFSVEYFSPFIIIIIGTLFSVVGKPDLPLQRGRTKDCVFLIYIMWCRLWYHFQI